MSYSPRFKVGECINNRFLIGDFKEGGMGEVYLCFDMNNGTPCVLKTFKKGVSQNFHIAQDFEGEVDKWIRLGLHPNVVTCYFMEYYENLPFMCLEWVENFSYDGADLRTLLRYGPLSLRKTIQFSIDVCQGLIHAHNQVNGILVHCDLKPENILIMQGAIAKVTDFGLSKINTLREQKSGTEKSETKQFSNKRISGTPPYMAPEQWSMEYLDERTDVYALGCIMYEMLTGRVLFSGASIEELKSKHLNFDVSSRISELNTVPSSIRSLISGCLQKEKELRIPTISELSNRLEAIYKQLFNRSPEFYSTDSKYSIFLKNNIAATLATLERNDEALSLLNETLSIREDATAYANRAIIHKDLGNYQQALLDVERAIQIEPDYGLAYNNLATILGCLESYDEAMINHNKSIEIEPKNPSFFSNRGITLHKLGKTNEALSDYAYALELNPINVHTYLNRSTIFLENKQYELALKDLNQAIELDQFSYYAYLMKGDLYAEIGEFSTAFNNYEIAIQIRPNKPEAYLCKGNAKANIGNYDEALREYSKSIEINPNKADAYYNQAVTFEKLEKTDNALSSYSRAIKVDPDHFSSLFNRAGILLKGNHGSEALSDCNAAIRVKPLDADVYILRGRIWCSLNNVVAAFKDFQKALELAPELPNAYLERGALYLRLEKIYDALDDFSKAIDFQPDNAQCYLHRGEAYKRLRLYDSALSDFNKALELSPDLARGFAQRGSIFTSMEKFEEAFSNFDRAIKLNAKLPEIYTARGLAYHLLGKYEEALKDFDQAISLDPTRTEPHIKRGNTLAELLKPLEALKEFNFAIKIDPYDSTNYFNAGLFLLNIKRFRLALPYLRKAAEMGHTVGKNFYHQCKSFLLASSFANTNCVKDFIAEIKTFPFYLDELLVSELINDIKQVQSAFPDYGNEYVEALKDLHTEQMERPLPQIEFEFIENLDGHEGGALYDQLPKTVAPNSPKETIKNFVKEMLTMGVTYLEKGDIEQAINVFTSGLHVAPSDPTLFMSRAHAYSLKGDHPSALSDLSQAIRLNSQDNSPVVFRGLLHLDKGNYEDAMSDFNMVLHLRPSSHDCIFIANQLLKCEKYNDAIRFYEVAALLGDNAAGKKVRDLISGLVFDLWMKSVNIEAARNAITEFPHICSVLTWKYMEDKYINKNSMQLDRWGLQRLKQNLGYLYEAVSETGIEFFFLQQQLFEKFGVAIDDEELTKISRNYLFLRRPGYTYLLISSILAQAPSDVIVSLQERMKRLYEIINDIYLDNN